MCRGAPRLHPGLHPACEGDARDPRWHRPRSRVTAESAAGTFRSPRPSNPTVRPWRCSATAAPPRIAFSRSCEGRLAPAPPRRSWTRGPAAWLGSSVVGVHTRDTFGARSSTSTTAPSSRPAKTNVSMSVPSGHRSFGDQEAVKKSKSGASAGCETTMRRCSSSATRCGVASSVAPCLAASRSASGPRPISPRPREAVKKSKSGASAGCETTMRRCSSSATRCGVASSVAPCLAASRSASGPRPISPRPLLTGPPPMRGSGDRG